MCETDGKLISSSLIFRLDNTNLHQGLKNAK